MYCLYNLPETLLPAMPPLANVIFIDLLRSLHDQNGGRPPAPNAKSTVAFVKDCEGSEAVTTPSCSESIKTIPAGEVTFNGANVGDVFTTAEPPSFCQKTMLTRLPRVSKMAETFLLLTMLLIGASLLWPSRFGCSIPGKMEYSNGSVVLRCSSHAAHMSTLVCGEADVPMLDHVEFLAPCRI